MPTRKRVSVPIIPLAGTRYCLFDDSRNPDPPHEECLRRTVILLVAQEKKAMQNSTNNPRSGRYQ